MKGNINVKKWNIALIAAALALTMTACGAETDETEENAEETNGDIVSNIAIDEDTSSDIVDPFTAEAYDYMANDLSGFVKVGEYKGLTVTKESDVLTDEEFDAEIATLLDSYSYYEEYTDRAVEEGDSVIADYSGYHNDVQFSGGTATNTTLTAASNTGYIPGFAEAFIGQMPGVEFSFDVTFPESYDNAELAGQEVTFVCTVHAILGDELIVPELTDEFVVENFGYNNVEEFRIAYRSTVQEQKKYNVESNMYTDLWLQVVENSEILAYPEEEVNRLYGQQRVMYEQYAAQFGTDYDTFLSSYLNVTDADLLEESRTYVREDLVMYQLVKDLGIELSDEEYQTGLEFFAESYGMTTQELTSYYGEDTIRATITWQKLMETVAAEANIVEE